MMKISENTGAANAPSSFETLSKVGDGSGTRNARSRTSEIGQSPARMVIPDTRVFREASSHLQSSLARSAPSDKSMSILYPYGLPDSPTLTPDEHSDVGPHPADADSGLSTLHSPEDSRTAMTDHIGADEASSDHQRIQAFSNVSTEDAQSLEVGDDALNVAEIGTAGHSDTVLAQDEVITLSARAASALAAAAETVPFGAASLGVASNMADFLAPAIVDGIENPLLRSVAASGFSGIFLGLTASVTTALGQDIAQRIAENRITPNASEGEVSYGSKLWSAMKNQTIPAYIGFAAAFVTANALDAEAGKLGDTEPNSETVLLKLARGAAGGVGLGLAQEAARTFSDHSLTRTEAGRIFDNTRSLGESIKRNVTSLPKAISAYTRPTEKGGKTELGTILGAVFGFATYATIFGVVSSALQSEYGENTDERMSEPAVQAAIATAAGVAGFVIADQLTRNIYANVMPTRAMPEPAADAGDVEVPEELPAARVEI